MTDVDRGRSTIDKAYILRVPTETSYAYAKTAAESCDKVGLPWEYFEGFYQVDPNAAWNSIGLKRHINRTTWVAAAQLCTAGHAKIWKKIRDNKETAVILEHDAIMLHDPRPVPIRNGEIIVLGYKAPDPENFDHVESGPPRYLRRIHGHEGAHAYAISWHAAKDMLDEIEMHGVVSAVDNMYFLGSRKGFTQVPMAIMDPTAAIGWIRDSTIWECSSVMNYKWVESFGQNYKGDGATHHPVNTTKSK
tara:strand:+ start:3075 stop:3818 length:744 start_codon:yes stop_codon:yes gene_type:complete